MAIIVLERLLSPVGRRAGLDALRWHHAVAIGFFQCLALWPGVSRAAATILGAMMVGLERKTAIEYSFLAAVPVLCAATVFDLLKSLDVLQLTDIPVFAIGFVCAFLSAFVAIRYFLRLLSSYTLAPFGWYRIALAFMVLLFLQDGATSGALNRCHDTRERKPVRSFAWIEPTTLAEVSQALQAGHGKARLIAGGSDLLGELKDDIVAYEQLISLAGCAELQHIQQSDAGLQLGALVTLAQLEYEPRLQGPYRILAEAARGVATPEIRVQGTLGGNLCQRPRCLYYRSALSPCLKKGGTDCPAVEQPVSGVSVHYGWPGLF